MSNLTPYPNETNGIGDLYSTDEGRRMLEEAGENWLEWNDPRLIKITRWRMLTDRGFPFWDISYVRGLFVDDDGNVKNCQIVNLPFPYNQLSRKRWWSEIKAAAKRDGVNIYKLGLWDAVSKLW